MPEGPAPGEELVGSDDEIPMPPDEDLDDIPMPEGPPPGQAEVDDRP